MSLVTVLRVEDDQRKGPYIHQTYRTDAQGRASSALANRHSDFRYWGSTVEDDPELHPGPDDDPVMQTRWRYISWSTRRAARDYNFGFATPDRLRQWFFGERDTLELLNMHVAAYEVPHQAVIRGGWQLAFRRPSARFVGAVDLAGMVD